MRCEPGSTRTLRLAYALLAMGARPALADRDGREFGEEFREGRCLVEREGRSDGSCKVQRECMYRPGGPEFEKTFQDGPYRIEREQKADAFTR